MAEMVALEKFLCRSAPWRWFGRRYVVPWAMQGIEPSGHGLEIGGGSGVMAAQLLAMFPELKLTVTDLDRSMFADAPKDLARSGDRVQVEVADATRLSFPDGSFDYVFSFIMLHHVLEWEKAIIEGVRVLRPGGWLVGYDLLDTRTFRLFHRLERADVRLMTMERLYVLLDSLPVDRSMLTTGRGGFVVRFRLRKQLT